MQFGDKARPLLFVDDETQVQVIGRLRHQVDALLFKDLQRGRHARDDSPDLAPHKTDGRAIRNNTDATQLFEIMNERLFDVVRQHAVAGID